MSFKSLKYLKHECMAIFTTFEIANPGEGLSNGQVTFSRLIRLKEKKMLKFWDDEYEKNRTYFRYSRSTTFTLRSSNFYIYTYIILYIHNICINICKLFCFFLFFFSYNNNHVTLINIPLIITLHGITIIHRQYVSLRLVHDIKV